MKDAQSFLDQYSPKKEPPSIAANGDISTFLDQYKKPKEVAVPDIPKQPEPKLSEQLVPPQPVVEEKPFRPAVITESFKKGFADFAALPGYAVDLVNWPLHKLGLTPEEPFGGSTMIRKGWQALTGYRETPPETTAERYAGRMAEFAGSGVVPGIGLASKAAKAGATMAELKTILGVEVASAITGGAGAEFGGTVGEKVAGAPGRVVGELTGGISIGMAPIYFKAAGGTIWNALKSVKTITGERASLIENTAKRQITAAIGEDPAALGRIQRTSELQAEIPGFKPSLAAAADAKGLASIQTSLDTRSIENYNNALDGIRKSQEAIANYYDEFFTRTGRKLSSTKVFKQTIKAMEVKATEAEKQISELSAAYKRKPTAEIGASLRELRKIKKAKVSIKVEQAYDELYKTSEDLGIVDDMSDLYVLASDFVRQDATVFQRMPGIYKKMRTIFGREIDPNVPFKEQKIMAKFKQIHSLQKETAREYGQALKAGDNEKQYYLGQVKELLDGKLAQWDDPVYGTFADHKRVVDKYWLEEYHKVFRKGVGGKIAHETRFGKETPDGKIVSSLVLQKGTSRGIDEFNKLYEGVPEAQILLRDGILDVFSKEALKDNVISPKSVKTFLKDYKEVLDKIPDLRNTLMNSEALTSALVNRKATIVRKSKQFARDSISPYAKIAGYGSADEAVEAGLKDPKIMRILTRNTKTVSEKQDLVSIIADHVLEKPDAWNYLLKNESMLAGQFNRLKPGHFKKLKNIAEAQSIISKYHPSQGPRTKAIEDPFYKKYGTTFASAVAQWRWALYYNKTSAYYPAVDMGSKYIFKIRQGQVEKLMERSLYDPDLATTLAELSKLKPIDVGNMRMADMLSDLGQYAINNGIRASVTAMETQ